MDPAAWAARLEDTFYNNAFKNTEVQQTTVYSTVVKISIEFDLFVCVILCLSNHIFGHTRPPLLEE